jgi:hypothetical protein
MPINLDSCIAGIFVPGNIGASSGETPVVRPMPSFTLAITSSAAVSVDENEVLAHSLVATEFAGWSIVGGADQAQFEISGSTLRWASDGTQDYETPLDADTNNVYVVTVRAASMSFSTADQTISVTVDDVSEFVTRQAMTPYTFANTTGARQAMTPGLMINEG